MPEDGRGGSVPALTARRWAGLVAARAPWLREGWNWRGPDGSGFTASTWLAVLVLVWVAAKVFFPWEPALLLAPPLLAGALALPFVQVGAARAGASPAGRWLARAEIQIAAAALAGTAVIAFSFVFTDKVPIDTMDNQMYIARAELLDRALSEGRLPRWSHLVQGGDPQLDLYPHLVNFIVVVIHRVFLPHLPMVAAYTTVSIASWWLRGLATYVLARCFSGPVVATALAAASLLDVGSGTWDGTWQAGFYWGLIHSNVGLSLCMLALAQQIKCLREPTSRRLVGCAAIVGLAIYTHPVALVVEGVTLGALGLTVLAAHQRRRAAAWTALATLLGLLLAGAWSVPQMYALGKFGHGFAVAGEDFAAMGKGLLDSSIPTSSFGAFVGVGLVAVTAAIVTRRADLLFPAVATTALWCLSVVPLVIETQIVAHLPSLLGGQLRRLIVASKAFAFAPIAWLLATMYAPLRRAGSLKPMAVVGRALLLGLLFLGPARSLGAGLGNLGLAVRGQFPPVSATPWRSAGVVTADQQATFDWLATTRRADPSPTPWRASMHTGASQWAAWASPVRTGVPAVQFNSGMVGVMIANRPRELSLAGFRDWNIRFVVTEQPAATLPGLIERFASGAARVWEVPDYDDRLIVAPPGVSIRNVAVAGDEIRFDVSGAPPEGANLQVRVAWFPRWIAKQGGRAIPVLPKPPRADAVARQDQLSLHVGNGPVVISCTGPLPLFWVGCFFSLIAAILLAWLARPARLQALERRLERLVATVAADARRLGEVARARRRPREVVFAAVLALAVIGLVGSRATRTKLLMAPVSTSALTVSARMPGRRFERCPAQLWKGEYTCPGESAIVRPGVGGDPVLDQSAEWAHLWSGIAVSLKREGLEVRMRWPRFALRGRRLALKTDVDGTLDVAISADGRALVTTTWSGHGTQDIFVPEDVPRSGTLEIRLTSRTTHANIVFQGDLTASSRR